MDAFLDETNGRGTYVGHMLTLLLLSIRWGGSIRTTRYLLSFSCIVLCVRSALYHCRHTTFYGKFYFVVVAKYFESSSVECAEQKFSQAKKAKMTYT